MPAFFCALLNMKIQPDQTQTKKQLRRDLRLRRAGLDSRKRLQRDKAIGTQLLRLVREKGFNTVAAFLAFDGEPNLEAALIELAGAGKRLALPIVHEVPGRDYMTFRSWSPGEPLQANRFGILEPVHGGEVPIPAIDLVLVPLVGWDRTGARLGMGGSFYDRAFQPFAQLDKPLRLGVAYLEQECDEIPLDPWDIRLHGMLTPGGWFTCTA